ncbi:helix-turn-helix domain-containing protein [Paenibacillus mucilaginosus]|uniref:helix-turn-helix domain-containing protein n=1 Tax=Paenibacillus mucilaginosus TaxID=61624 RepID=UPI003D1CF188
MIPSKRILIVDDEPRSRQGLAKMLEAWSAGRHRIRTADNGYEALRILESEPVHLLLSDIRMPEISGLQLAGSGERVSWPNQPAVILISGYAEFEYAQKAIELGVTRYLLKPVSREKLLDAVERALETEEQRSRLGLIEKVADPQLLTAAVHQSAVSEPVEEALRYMDEHLHLPFTLREVAEQIHLNASYFSVLFKEQMGMTFSEYVTRRRLQKAKEMLLQTRLPIAEIAERAGYQSAKYFSKIFKEYEGTSPGAYRSGT